jgi:hypothetical protein
MKRSLDRTRATLRNGKARVTTCRFEPGDRLKVFRLIEDRTVIVEAVLLPF